MSVGIINRLEIIQINHIKSAAADFIKLQLHIFFKTSSVIQAGHQIPFRKFLVISCLLAVRTAMIFISGCACQVFRPAWQEILLRQGKMDM